MAITTVAARWRGPDPSQQRRQSARYTSFRFTTHLVAAGINAAIGNIGKR